MMMVLNVPVIRSSHFRRKFGRFDCFAPQMKTTAQTKERKFQSGSQIEWWKQMAQSSPFISSDIPKPPAHPISHNVCCVLANVYQTNNKSRLMFLHLKFKSIKHSNIKEPLVWNESGNRQGTHSLFGTQSGRNGGVDDFATQNDRQTRTHTVTQDPPIALFIIRWNACLLLIDDFQFALLSIFPLCFFFVGSAVNVCKCLLSVCGSKF